MIRRGIAIVAALAAWSVGGLLLTGCAGFLFSAVIHPFASSGWITSALLAFGLGASGMLIAGMGCWLAYRVRTPMHDEAVVEGLLVSDDAMWLS
ncbi:MAG TPA: hypothetical protein VNC60_01105 [Actinomycetota bacterium]|nr:hypothetical protein [Actinomycetota bacterium]